MPGIPALRRWKQKGCNEFKISLDYTVRISQNNFHVSVSELKHESCLDTLEARSNVIYICKKVHRLHFQVTGFDVSKACSSWQTACLTHMRPDSHSPVPKIEPLFGARSILELRVDSVQVESSS